MAASLANLEAHRPSAGFEVRIPERNEQPKTGEHREARTYLDEAPRQLARLRAAILDAEITWKRKRAEMQARYDDDLGKLNFEYTAILTDLNDLARRIQATRE
jgi:hypothetical protein